MSGKNLVAEQVVRCSIILESTELGSEFFPAHLSVALIDAVFNPRLRYKKIVVPIIERYCRHFGLRRTRTDRENLPPVEKQETLRDLIGHYEESSLKYMKEKVFDARYRSPGKNAPTKAENVLLAAGELQKIGIDTLQDAREASLERPEEIKSALIKLRGIAERTINMFLMYSGNDDFVKGDIHVCRFVEKALGRKVSAAEAEKSVKDAARELKIPPRILDYKIWEHELQPKPAKK